MCLLILQKQGARIEESSLKNAYENNPDGVGYSYIANDKLITKKFRKYKKFLNNWKSDNNDMSSKTPFLLHFRLATHGMEEGTFNVHPFRVRDGMVFAHNGVISEVDRDIKLSDTQVFNRDILKHLKKTFLNDQCLLKLIEGFIGGSKLVFLNRDKSFKIVNESAGHWLDRVSSISPKPTKILSKGKTEKCEWCSDDVDILHHTNIADYYADEEPSYLWMCEACITEEEDFIASENGFDTTKDDVQDWNDSFKNTDQLAVWEGGKSD